MRPVASSAPLTLSMGAKPIGTRVRPTPAPGRRKPISVVPPACRYVVADTAQSLSYVGGNPGQRMLDPKVYAPVVGFGLSLGLGLGLGFGSGP